MVLMGSRGIRNPKSKISFPNAGVCPVPLHRVHEFLPEGGLESPAFFSFDSA